MSNALTLLQRDNVRIGVCSPGIMRIAGLTHLLHAPRARLLPAYHARATRHCDLYIGWGNKRSGIRARRLAATTGTPFLLLEDAFLRSLAPHATFGEPPLGLLLDDVGVYYDASAPSRLEQCIIRASNDPAARSDGARLMQLAARLRVCKYNNFESMPVALRERLRGNGQDIVLVIDQTAGDLSISGAQADEYAFIRMLEAAIDENPGATIIVKLHPEVLTGHKRGHLAQMARRHGCLLLAENLNPWDLLRHCHKVYTVSSLTGFEALMAGVPVRCFGMPFYAGWGLTHDDRPAPARRTPHKPCVEQLVHAALRAAASYADPHDGSGWTPEQAMRQLAEWRDAYSRTRNISCCLGFSRWKRKRVQSMLMQPSGKRDLFVTSPRRALRKARREGGAVVAWASRVSPRLEADCRRLGVPLWRMEDGFIRSVGLGANLHLPVSLVLDDIGIYYDSTRPSRLENILQHEDFSSETIERAHRIMELLTSRDITKYNLRENAPPPIPATGRPIIVVPGQVDDDASVRTGGGGISGLSFLQRVRATRPDGFIIYKPHPDVLAGQRRGLADPVQAQRHADLFLPDASITSLLEIADEVHVLTSLAGFEALLRGRRVVCHGIPFYAGWGLTEDLLPVPRRTRKRTLPELVAGALLRYPLYYDPVSERWCGPEVIINRISEWRRHPPPPSLLVRLRVLQGHLRRALSRLPPPWR